MTLQQLISVLTFTLINRSKRNGASRVSPVMIWFLRLFLSQHIHAATHKHSASPLCVNTQVRANNSVSVRGLKRHCSRCLYRPTCHTMEGLRHRAGLRYGFCQTVVDEEKKEKCAAHGVSDELTG